MIGRGTLAQRISLLACAIAVITALLAGTLAIGLITRKNLANASSTLAQLADAAQETADVGTRPEASQQRARRLLQASKVQSVTVSANGQLVGSTALAGSAITSAEIGQLLAGHTISKQATVNGQTVLVEGRPTRIGAIVLLQRRTDATAFGDALIQQLLIALLVGVVLAVMLGILVAARISRPLRRTAQAAHALAEGRRDVAVVPQGPAEVAEVAAAVNSLASALSHSEARQREFLLSVSHDLRTPLTAIVGYAESLANGVVEPAQSPAVGAIMLAEAHRLNRLVADLLDLARVGAQEFRIELARVDVAALARGAAQVWSDRCGAVGVLFRLEVRSEPVWCHTDLSRVRQILDGLFENALRVTSPGSPIVLSVRADADPHTVLLEVRDGGPGLTDSDLAVAFERSVLYERYRGVRQVGTGLGLAIVDGLTRRLGGTVEAGHSIEGGARFTVRLPTGEPSAG
ncbi:MAG: HAMP domain-containing histidine kinase [Cellulomonas sp.]|uniref:sensor histidine kinase n=1 Tax=Cellulomonas sp. TaxID=40001 RepID=UPI0017D5A792|nr:HAMP domain-containing sensor histidine kinase [Cellulomonas sp.]NMM16737.1 HAMP domain-containing histidine kinase [Cellulomonas sp.]NMM30223.1 HAMP domain-containing histidine kinase [Cellulomonas sp.]